MHSDFISQVRREGKKKNNNKCDRRSELENKLLRSVLGLTLLREGTEGYW